MEKHDEYALNNIYDFTPVQQKHTPWAKMQYFKTMRTICIQPPSSKKSCAVSKLQFDFLTIITKIQNLDFLHRVSQFHLFSFQNTFGTNLNFLTGVGWGRGCHCKQLVYPAVICLFVHEGKPGKCLLCCEIVVITDINVKKSPPGLP